MELSPNENFNFPSNRDMRNSDAQQRESCKILDEHDKDESKSIFSIQSYDHPKLWLLNPIDFKIKQTMIILKSCNLFKVYVPLFVYIINANLRAK